MLQIKLGAYLHGFLNGDRFFFQSGSHLVNVKNNHFTLSDVINYDGQINRVYYY